jgi:hypothetical protein
METTNPSSAGPARRRFLAAGGILSLFAMLKLWRVGRKTPVIDCGPDRSGQPDQKKETVRMLGQDGRLVEVDASRMRMLKKKITDDELQNWVRRKSANDNQSKT